MVNTSTRGLAATTHSICTRTNQRSCDQFGTEFRRNYVDWNPYLLTQKIQENHNHPVTCRQKMENEIIKPTSGKFVGRSSKSPHSDNNRRMEKCNENSPPAGSKGKSVV